MSKGLRSSGAVGFAGLILGLLLAVSILNSAGGPRGLLRAPAEDPELLALIVDLVGPVPTAPQFGHDGKFFFLLALDPFLRDKETLGQFLDHPAYRAERILYPMLAGGFGLLNPQQTLWGLVVVNVLAIGLGSWFTARICSDLGLPAILGLFFTLNPGVIYELGINSASIVGMALGFAGIGFAMRDRLGYAGAAFLAAGLTRETMILLCVGTVAWLFSRRRLRAAAVLTLPIGLTGVWLLVVRSIMPPPEAELPSSFDLPLRGVLEVVPDWVSAPFYQQVTLAWLFVCVVVCILAAVRRPGPFAWGAAMFTPVFFLLSAPVVRYDINVSRAVLPLLTAGPIFIWAFFSRSSNHPRALARVDPESGASDQTPGWRPGI